MVPQQSEGSLRRSNPRGGLGSDRVNRLCKQRRRETRGTVRRDAPLQSAPERQRGAGAGGGCTEAQICPTHGALATVIESRLKKRWSRTTPLKLRVQATLRSSSLIGASFPVALYQSPSRTQARASEDSACFR
ncbi:hypothetical protein SKAU_G00319430 [Synaphobranchus kaupii]|uniref:Uncharacterized protein n=1 Tax=Synaphobranchus kaupii TaxID=118154 RepID=A0A9Q1IIP9_SYNKA|nr:hypothetical protein SKAU_G00319430 [Synaphobranchus kaupii]